MRGLASREIALIVLTEIERRDIFIKEAFEVYRDTLNEKDQSLAQEIIFGVTRWRLLIDYNFNRFLKQPLKSTTAVNIFRLTAYQLLFLSSIPAHAAINIGVELLKKKESIGMAKTGNAVFRKLAEQGLGSFPGNTLKARSVNTSHPLWMIKAWARELTAQNLKTTLEKNNRPHGVWFRVNTAKAMVEECVKQFSMTPLPVGSGRLSPYLFLRENLSGVLASKLFLDGGLSVQDPAAWFAIRLLDWKKGDSILDLCSAPGGKAAALAEHYGYHQPIICSDISFSRLKKILDARDRLGHTTLKPVVMDGLQTALNCSFDNIFIDAPCSNLGVIRRRPEVKWRQSPKSIARLADLQKDLLEAASLATRPGSAVVYSTCSPLRKETADVVGDFLDKHPDWVLEPAQNFIPSEYVKENCFWIYPGETEMDGFFAARLIRKKI